MPATFLQQCDHALGNATRDGSLGEPMVEHIRQNRDKHVRHPQVWLVESKPIWLPRAYLKRGDLEPARGNLHVCKLVRELTNIQIRTVTAEQQLCSECICPTNMLQLNEGRKAGRQAWTWKEREGRKKGRKEGELGRKRERRNSYRERGRKRSTQYTLVNHTSNYF